MRNFLDRVLPIVFWIAILVVATWVSWRIVTGREAVGPVSIQESTAGNGEVPPAIVDQPVLEEVSADGSVRWTLYANRIVNEQNDVMVLDTPRAMYRFESGELLEVRGENGTYDQQAGLLELTGAVTGEARRADFRFSVDTMTWDSNASLLTATGGVEVVREGMVFRGAELRLDLAHEFARLEVNGGVEISSTPEAIQDLGVSE